MLILDGITSLLELIVLLDFNVEKMHNLFCLTDVFACLLIKVNGTPNRRLILCCSKYTKGTLSLSNFILRITSKTFYTQYCTADAKLNIIF